MVKDVREKDKALGAEGEKKLQTRLELRRRAQAPCHHSLPPLLPRQLHLPFPNRRLLLHATSNGAGDRDLNSTDSIEALIEPPNSVNLSSFSSPPKYDYMYCGSSFYGNLSPQRVRKWIAYHVTLFGGISHFVIHDAGGVHLDVLEVLRPWMELDYVSLHDIRDQERFDGYYHNQFLIVNNCLHRYRFDAKWMFFFDVDEFIFVPGKKSL